MNSCAHGLLSTEARPWLKSQILVLPLTGSVTSGKLVCVRLLVCEMEVMVVSAYYLPGTVLNAFPRRRH